MDTRKLHELGTWRIFSQFNLAMRIKWSEARSQDNTRCSKSYWIRIGDFFLYTDLLLTLQCLQFLFG